MKSRSVITLFLALVACGVGFGEGETPPGMLVDEHGFYSPIQSNPFPSISTYDALTNNYAGSTSVTDDLLSRYSVVESDIDKNPIYNPPSSASSLYGPVSGPVTAQESYRAAGNLTFDFFSDIRKYRKEYTNSHDEIYNGSSILQKNAKYQFVPPTYGSYQNLRDLMTEKTTRY